MIGKIRIGLQNKVFYTAWLLLHIAYQLQWEIRDYLSFNWKYVKSRLLSCLPLYSHEAEIAGFVETVSKIQKVPKHLAISVIPESKGSVLSTLLGQLWLFSKASTGEGTNKKDDDVDCKDKGDYEEINLQALAKVVAWAYAANIPVVSLYDYHGILKMKFKELGCYIQEEVQQDFWAVKQCRNVTDPPVVKFHNVHKSNGYINGVNGSKSHQYLHIFVYSRSDGKPALVKAAKDICTDKLKSFRINSESEKMESSIVPVPSNDSNEVDERTLDMYLNRCNGWPSSLTDAKTDPDLMVILGNIKSTLGFLPWHIRLTEIHWLPPLRRVELSDFLGSLYKYSRCQQRFGT